MENIPDFLKSRREPGFLLWKETEKKKKVVMAVLAEVIEFTPNEVEWSRYSHAANHVVYIIYQCHHGTRILNQLS